MHGVVFSEFKRYVDTKFGVDKWGEVMKGSGFSEKVYLPIRAYPDEEMGAIITAHSKIINQPPDVVLKSFGEFIAPTLLGMYRMLIRPEWRTLDVIEHTEETIHRVVRVKNPGAEPPELVVSRLSPKEVMIRYTSKRKLCPLCQGIAQGVANYFNERVDISELSCMLKGSPVCSISVKLIA